MSDTGDRQPPKDPTPGHDPDDLVGFASPGSLAGRPRAPEPEPEAVVEPVPEPAPAPVAEPVDARAAFEPAAPPPPPEPAFGRRDREPVPEAPMGLYAIYALILFAVPTLGVSAVIALLAVTGRAGPSGDVAASHFVFQQRTLWAGGVVALAGAILIVVGLGVFVLFALAVWLILRGAAGVLKLKAGRAMPNPRGWLF